MNPNRNFIAVRLLIAGGICLIAVNCWLAFQSIGTLEQSQGWVQHTYQVIAQTAIIRDSAKDAEIGERGYLITGDDSLLAPYLQARAALPGELQEFKSLTADNPRQQQRIDEMQKLLDARLALLKRSIELRHAGAGTTQSDLGASATGKSEMDQLRGLGTQMEDEERGLLAVRIRAATRASQRARITVGLASALDFLLLLAALRFFVRERSLRIASERSAIQLAEARAAAEAGAEEVRTLNAVLEERVRQRTAELEVINRELEAFSYSVSHDLRAPLRTVDGFSLALQEDYSDAVDATGKDYINRVRGGVQRMGQLIDALLQLSRITRAEINREDFNLTSLTESICANLRQENPGRQLEFRVQPSLTANGDPRLIGVALENLLGNAVKFTAKIPAAVVEVGWDPDQNGWFVRDNGAGFDMTYADKLFNAFNRLHGDKDFRGSGIGLATVARVIRRHQGRIWADSQVDHGATFWFTLG